MEHSFSLFFYLIASTCFILALQGLSSAKTSRQGNLLGIVGMGLAIVTTLVFAPQIKGYALIFFGIVLGGGIGWLIASRIQMTALPQLVAAFHSLVGLAAVCVAGAALTFPENFPIMQGKHITYSSLIEMGLGAVIGAITFTGSLVAFGKLQGLIGSAPFSMVHRHKINAALGGVLFIIGFLFVLTASQTLFVFAVLLAALLGFLLILPIGGADMPVVVSMLNSYSGWAAAGIGFTLSNPLLIIVGALVGASGAILSYIMCKGMNRSILSIISGGFGDIPAGESQGTSEQSSRPVTSGSAEDAAFILKNAQSVMIVPGYGMAVAQAQHPLREMVDLLKKEGVQVRFAIHPVAGRMPGHMNVLLAEANVPYEDVFELEDINSDFSSTDVAFVIGANDVTNPSARTDTSSPIYGMPILDVDKARTVMFIKRSMASGYSGVDNPLFYDEKTLMLFGDAKKMCEEIVKAFHTV
ncbi:MAG: NAD(P)(+) transhydrogenase (Re/Si-specific) subunit beta [Alphaproteobacteria bacterium]